MRATRSQLQVQASRIQQEAAEPDEHHAVIVHVRLHGILDHHDLAEAVIDRHEGAFLLLALSRVP